MSHHAHRAFLGVNGGMKHKPVRPAWACTACGEQWPCAGAQAEIRAMHGGDIPAMMTYMTGFLPEATTDMPEMSQSVLLPRFLDWCLH